MTFAQRFKIIAPIFVLVFLALMVAAAIAPRPVNTSPVLTPYERMEQEQKQRDIQELSQYYR